MQRIKIPTDKAAASKAQQRDVKTLRLVHVMLVHTMKAKQTTDRSHVEALRAEAHDLRHLYEKL